MANTSENTHYRYQMKQLQQIQAQLQSQYHFSHKFYVGQLTNVMESFDDEIV